MANKTSETPRNYRWYVLGLLTVVSMFSIADRLVFSILLEDIKAEFAFSDFQIGLLGGSRTGQCARTSLAQRLDFGV
jgi:hypothetical protein